MTYALRFVRFNLAGKILLLAAALIVSCPVPVSAQGSSADLSSAVYDYTINCWWRSFIVGKLMTFKLSPGCWTKMLEKDGWGVKTSANYAYSVGDYAKNQGFGDLEAVESANNNDRMANKPQVEQMVDALKDKVSFTLQADAINCSDGEWDLVHRYMSTIGEFIGGGSWKPRGGAAFITLIVTPVVKDVSVAVNPDGKHFTVTAPSQVEPGEWDTKITKGLQKGGK